MGRRQAAESANAALKGGFVDVSRAFFRVFGLTKITVLLAFTVAAYNLDRIRAFAAKLRAERTGPPQTRAKRRVGTWLDLLPPIGPERATGPPGS